MNFRKFLSRAAAFSWRARREAAHAGNSALLCYRLLSAVADDAPDGILVTDVEGTIQWVNREFSRMTGYQRLEAIGSTPRILECRNHAPEFYALMWRTILADLPWSGMVWARRKDGSEYMLDTVVTPVRDSAGKTEHFVAVLRGPERAREAGAEPE